MINDRLEDASDELEQFVRAHLERDARRARPSRRRSSCTAGRRRSAQRPAAAPRRATGVLVEDVEQLLDLGAVERIGLERRRRSLGERARARGRGYGPARRVPPGRGAGGVVVAERRRAGQRLEQDRADAPDVGRRPSDPPRACSGARLDRVPSPGLRARAAARSRGRSASPRPLGDHVGRLDVEVEHAVAVQVAQRGAELQPEVARLGRAEAAARLDQRARASPRAASRARPAAARRSAPRTRARGAGAPAARAAAPRRAAPPARARSRAGRAAAP